MLVWIQRDVCVHVCVCVCASQQSGETVESIRIYFMLSRNQNKENFLLVLLNFDPERVERDLLLL